MTLVPPARHLLRAKNLVDARYREPLDVHAGFSDPPGNHFRMAQLK